MRNILLLLTLLSGTVFSQDIPRSLRTFKGDYPKFPVDTVITQPFEVVFDKTLEAYKASGLPTDLVDKPKGLISTGFTEFYRRYTFEQKRKLLSSVAYVVVERDPAYKPSSVKGVFETQIIPINASSTRVIVSLKDSDARFVNTAINFDKKLKMQSTGVFEKEVIKRVSE